VPGPVEAGFHRVAWDLRYPILDPWQPEAEREGAEEGAGVLVAPGRFSVTMSTRIDGAWTDLGQRQSFEVVSVREPTLPGTSQPERVAFDRQVDELRRASTGTVKAIDALVFELDAILEILPATSAEPSLYETANSIRQGLKRQRDRLTENPTRGIYNDLGQVPVDDRLGHARFAPKTNAYGPTPAQRESYAIAREVYADTRASLGDLVDVQYDALKRSLDAAGVPWTPGRSIQR
jgi:hypothetical protein